MPLICTTFHYCPLQIRLHCCLDTIHNASMTSPWYLGLLSIIPFKSTKKSWFLTWTNASNFTLKIRCVIKSIAKIRMKKKYKIISTKKGPTSLSGSRKNWYIFLIFYNFCPAAGRSENAKGTWNWRSPCSYVSMLKNYEIQKLLKSFG